MVATDRGLFTQALTSQGVIESAANYNYSSPLIPPYKPIDPTGEAAIHWEGEGINAQGLYVGGANTTKVGTVYPSGEHQSFTFSVFDLNNNVLFTRTDKACPKARIQNEECKFLGQNNGSVTSYFNNQQCAFLSRNYHVETDLFGNETFCVDVVKHQLVGKGSFSSNSCSGGLVVIPQVTVCSPKGCKTFPLITTAPGYDNQCPPGTFAIDCEDVRCCYDNNCNLVKTIPLNNSAIKPPLPNNQGPTNNYSQKSQMSSANNLNHSTNSLLSNT